MSGPDKSTDDGRMTLGEHLEELRRRILYALAGFLAAMGVGLAIAPNLIGILKAPYLHVMARLGLEGNLVVLDVSAGLVNYLKVGFYAGIVLSSPWLFYQLWAFVAVGLYPRERRHVVWAVPTCSVLFIGGALFFLFVVADDVLFYLLQMSKWMGVMPLITFSSHVSFMTSMMVVFGLAFQTPLVIVTLRALGIVSMRALHRYRRHVIVGILILAALMTPPDPFSQLAMAVPMWLLYELGILLSYLLVRGRRASEAG